MFQHHLFCFVSFFFFERQAPFTLKPSRFDGKLTQKSDTWALGVTWVKRQMEGWWEGGRGKGPGKTGAFWGGTQKGWDVWGM